MALAKDNTYAVNKGLITPAKPVEEKKPKAPAKAKDKPKTKSTNKKSK